MPTAFFRTRKAIITAVTVAGLTLTGCGPSSDLDRVAKNLTAIESGRPFTVPAQTLTAHTGEAFDLREGTAGRFALLETMPMHEEIKRLIIEGRSALDIKNAAIRDHEMITLRRCALLNALRGKTSIEEVLRVTMPDHMPGSSGEES